MTQQYSRRVIQNDRKSADGVRAHGHNCSTPPVLWKKVGTDQGRVVDGITRRFVRGLLDDEISALFFGFGPT
jgi:hypothetical protein